MANLTYVKWVSPNLPMIRISRTNSSLHLTKAELVELRDELTEFIEFYKDQFNAEVIDQTGAYIDNYDYNAIPNWAKDERLD
jgi:hypothetical protein